MNDLYQHTLESVNVGILVFDPSGRLVYLNPAAEEILQGSAQALTGRHYRTLFRGSPAALRITRKALTEHAAVTGYDVELRLPHRPQAAGSAETSALPVIIGASPLSGPTGETRGAVMSIKTAEILTMVGQEEQAAVSAEEMQMLAYGIAHEIKNPLGGILGAAQWILRREASEEERKEGIRLIQREAERINGLVEKMLEMGKSPPHPRPFPLLPLLREAEELLRAEVRAQGKEIGFELRADPSLPPVLGHQDTIFRAIVNILKNAVEAIDGRGTIRIDALLNVNYRWSRGRGRKRSFLEITIADSGVGMSEEDSRKALLPFYTTKPKGTGLGLVMTRQAITRHGGKLEIKSVRGAGTTVKISLPADPGKK
ncbi:MAG: PAS domain-containing protein [Deltaproteobacteria bacterium]|nr:PAS domain-containing protein [Deltaproteobacteria bacterium]